jgi:orotate phosphoribosyltransferase
LGHVHFRDQIIDAFLDVIKNGHLRFDLVGGIATAGIPHAAFIADRMKMPMVYIRPKAKEHGKKNQVEGSYALGQSLVLIEYLVNQGSSLGDALNGVKDAGLNSSQCLCIVDYQMPEAKKRLDELSLTLHSLTDFDHLLQAALELKFIDLNGKKLLTDWHNDPKEWSKLF